MYLAIAIPTLLACLSIVSTVEAECCGAPIGLNTCGDNTYGTPCCGNGKCNIFCCNCDDGCRTGPDAARLGCVNQAEKARLICHAAASFGGADAYWSNILFCNSEYQSNLEYCESKKAGGGKRALDGTMGSPSLSRARRDESAGNAGSSDGGGAIDMFDMVDFDGDGNLTLNEYLAWATWRSGGQPLDPTQEANWVQYFLSFDTNKDNVVQLGETGP